MWANILDERSSSSGISDREGASVEPINSVVK